MSARLFGSTPGKNAILRTRARVLAVSRATWKLSAIADRSFAF
jgi:hypothetical protein